jgi:hypothetical protein
MLVSVPFVDVKAKQQLYLHAFQECFIQIQQTSDTLKEIQGDTLMFKLKYNFCI